MLSPIAVYLHTPFCPSKCGYCDFNSFAMDGEIKERTTLATIQEIQRSPLAGRPAKTIFFGGGTPTFLEESQIVRLLQAVMEAHPRVKGSEITSEANPGTVDWPKFSAMKQAGFNRISLGAQSFDSGDLLRLGRVHSESDVAKAVAAARRAGFDNINLDLMFALPGQSRKAWQTNLDLALQFRPQHLSLYCLTIEPNTRYYRHHLKGMLNLPDEDAQIAMYEDAIDACAKAGLEQYEISNFALPGRECRHNLCYWLGEEYAGYGPGAVGCAELNGERVRWINTKHPDLYSSRVEKDDELWCDSETLDSQTHRNEKVMLGLRLTRGFDPTDLDLNPGSLQKLTERGWIQEGSFGLRLTSAGRHFASDAASELMEV